MSRPLFRRRGYSIRKAWYACSTSRQFLRFVHSAPSINSPRLRVTVSSVRKQER